jgi:hypothetical protein
MSDQGDSASIESSFTNAISRASSNHPSGLPLTDVFTSMLANQDDIHENFFDDIDKKGVVCEVDDALSAFDKLESRLSEQVEADSKILNKTLLQVIQLDNQNLKLQMQSQNQLLKEINAALTAESAVPLNPVVIDLKSLDPAFGPILDQLSDPRVAFDWSNMADAKSGVSISVSSNMIKDGKLVIPWQMGKNDPEKTASLFLLALKIEFDGAALKNVPKLNQKMSDAAASGEAVSEAALSQDQKTLLDKNKSIVIEDTRSLFSIQLKI